MSTPETPRLFSRFSLSYAPAKSVVHWCLPIFFSGMLMTIANNGQAEIHQGALQASQTEKVDSASLNSAETTENTTESASDAVVKQNGILLAQQLEKAKDNKSELVSALRAVPKEHAEALKFLVVNMPLRDLRSLKADFLLENIKLAYKARGEVSWGNSIPHELFLNNVLPYANVSEQRDNWRKELYDRFICIAKQYHTPGEAALRLNHEVFSRLKVSYHATKRHRPDQSPFESAQIGYASCTGLSIIMADVCRAVGIPARLVGTPQWADHSSNHSWVEVWDQQWRFLGSNESGQLDQAWFVKIAAQADPTRWEHRIYAASFQQTKIIFPLAWDLRANYVSAYDVTRFYTNRRTKTFRVLNHHTGNPVKAALAIRLKGILVAAGKTDNIFAAELAGGLTYKIQITPLNGERDIIRTITLSDENNQLIDIRI